MILLPSLLLIKLLTLIDAQNQENIDRCPYNLNRNQYLHTHGEYCYEFTIFRHNYWKNAEEHCAHNGGHLVKIENMDQQLFLVDVLKHLGFHEKAIWIGLTDQVQEGSYMWSDGQAATFSFWGKGEPSFAHNFEDCVAMKVSNGGHWADYPCELPFIDDFSWICQYKLMPGVTHLSSTPQPLSTTEEPEVIVPGDNSTGNLVVG